MSSGELVRQFFRWDVTLIFIIGAVSICLEIITKQENEEKIKPVDVSYRVDDL